MSDYRQNICYVSCLILVICVVFFLSNICKYQTNTDTTSSFPLQFVSTQMGACLVEYPIITWMFVCSITVCVTSDKQISCEKFDSVCEGSLRSTCPPLSSSPPREQLCNRSCSNKHTHTPNPLHMQKRMASTASLEHYARAIAAIRLHGRVEF